MEVNYVTALLDSRPVTYWNVTIVVLGKKIMYIENRVSAAWSKSLIIHRNCKKFRGFILVLGVISAHSEYRCRLYFRYDMNF